MDVKERTLSKLVKHVLARGMIESDFEPVLSAIFDLQRYEPICIPNSGGAPAMKEVSNKVGSSGLYVSLEDVSDLGVQLRKAVAKEQSKPLQDVAQVISELDSKMHESFKKPAASQASPSRSCGTCKFYAVACHLYEPCLRCTHKAGISDQWEQKP